MKIDLFENFIRSNGEKENGTEKTYGPNSNLNPNTNMCVKATDSGPHRNFNQPEGVMATDQRSRTKELTGLEEQNTQIECVNQPEDLF